MLKNKTLKFCQSITNNAQRGSAQCCLRSFVVCFGLWRRAYGVVDHHVVTSLCGGGTAGVGWQEKTI